MNQFDRVVCRDRPKLKGIVEGYWSDPMGYIDMVKLWWFCTPMISRWFPARDIKVIS